MVCNPILRVVTCLLLLVCLGLADSYAQQCSRDEKLHLTLDRLQEPARVLLTEYPLMSPDQCYDTCCQYSSDDGSQCNAAVFQPIDTDADVGQGRGSCLLLECRPLFSNCRWTMSPTSRSSVARITHRNITQTTEPTRPVADSSSTTPSDQLIIPTTPAASTTVSMTETPLSSSSSAAAAAEAAGTASDDDDKTYYWDGFDYDDKPPTTDDVTASQLLLPLQSPTTPSPATTSAVVEGEDAFWNLLKAIDDGQTAADTTPTVDPAKQSDNADSDESDVLNSVNPTSAPKADDQPLTDKSEMRSVEGNGGGYEYDRWVDGGKPIKMIVVSDADLSEPGTLMSSAVVLSVLSVLAVLTVLLVVVGCHRACSPGSSRPRYVPLRDSTQATSVSEFPTNYLVSQPSSGYRASLLPK